MVGMRAITFTFKTQRAKWTFEPEDINICYADKDIVRLAIKSVHSAVFANADGIYQPMAQ